MEEKPRIIFFGTPGIAVTSLDALLEAEFNIAAVVTAPDKPSGRGLKMNASPVKQYALDHKLVLFQPDDLRDPLFLGQLNEISPRMAIVVAFRMLPPEVWKMPSLGTFNLHASLLPQYRGAAPINWALINGESETGVTTFLLDQKIDTGKILFQKKIAIKPDETAGELLLRLAETGAKLVVKTASLLPSGDLEPQSQEILSSAGTILKKAPKIHSSDCQIHWDKDITEIYNLIRGLSPVPGAFTSLALKGKPEMFLKIYRCSFEKTEHGDYAGKILTDGKSFLRIAAKNGYIHPTLVQPAGKKTMEIGEFLNGFGKYLL
ncbi:MAG: methionyl-tRNA formyltransferase [Bacteroidota bacterium]|nr:methionyl-tRNA formyltransferase [Bacteroidota bacterium]